jgi:hypothetical protein
MLHEYKKNQIEIKVLTYELFNKENRRLKWLIYLV